MNSAAVKFLPQSWRRQWVFGLILFLLAVLTFAPAMSAGYIWDDDSFVTQNPLLTASDGLRRIWFSFDSPSQYFPLTYTSFFFERHLWGLNPAGYHVVNILLHATTVVLVWLLLTRLRVPGAWLAAAIFGIHPVQVESVAWVAERKNVLMGVFFLLTLLGWVDFIEPGRKHPWRAYALSLVYYALSLTAKTTACTLPAALLLILWLKRIPIDRKRILQIIPFILLAAGMAFLSICWEHQNPGIEGKKLNIGALERVLIASHALWFYAGKLFWPANLTVDYPRWEVSASDAAAYGWLAGIILLTAAVWYLRRWTGRALEVGLLFFALTLGPMLGFVMHYMYVYSFVADHFQYLACLGIIALVAAGIARAAERLHLAFVQPLAGTIIIVTLGVLTWRQCETYADPETLWRTTLRINPQSWAAEGSLGTLAFDAGLFEEAITHYKKGLRLNPAFSQLHYNLGRTYFQMGRLNDSIDEYREEIKIAPDNIDAHANLGYSLMEMGRRTEAIAEFQRALAINPNFAAAHDNLGEALLKNGDLEGAIKHLERAVELEPRFVGEQDCLGIAFAKKGQFAQAIGHFEKGLELNPNDLNDLANFAWLLSTCPEPSLRDGSKALTVAQRALDLSGPANPAVLQSLAAAQAETGDFKSAAATARAALIFSVKQNNTQLSGVLRKEIDLYQRGKPERDFNARWVW